MGPIDICKRASSQITGDLLIRAVSALSGRTLCVVRANASWRVQKLLLVISCDVGTCHTRIELLQDGQCLDLSEVLSDVFKGKRLIVQLVISSASGRSVEPRSKEVYAV